MSASRKTSENPPPKCSNVFSKNVQFWYFLKRSERFENIWKCLVAGSRTLSGNFLTISKICLFENICNDFLTWQRLITWGRLFWHSWIFWNFWEVWFFKSSKAYQSFSEIAQPSKFCKHSKSENSRLIIGGNLDIRGRFSEILKDLEKLTRLKSLIFRLFQYFKRFQLSS